MDGILLIDKPLNWTSFDVVAKIRGLLRKEGYKNIKVGHSGTLDPMASGLLIVLVGKYTKQAELFTKLEKTYIATMFLGQISTTGDSEGEKTLVNDLKPTLQQINEVAKMFLGKSFQTPPAYSAIKINGQRAYKIVRSGKKPILEPRPIEIYKLDIKSYKYPLIELLTEVSSGTYIRSLVEDIGQKLGCGAYTYELKRTTIGSHSLKDAISLNEIDFTKIAKSLKKSSI